MDTLTFGYDEETDGVYARLNDGAEWTENSFDSIGQFFLDWPSGGHEVLLKWVDR